MVFQSRDQSRDVKQELFDKQVEYGFFEIVDCSEQENAEYAHMKNNGNALPENVRQYKDAQTDMYVDKFYYLKDSKLSDAERQEYLKYIGLDRLNTIKNCLLFFVILTLVSLSAYFVFSLI